LYLGLLTKPDRYIFRFYTLHAITVKLIAEVSDVSTTSDFPRKGRQVWEVLNPGTTLGLLRGYPAKSKSPTYL
jgi:hypothetical protein